MNEENILNILNGQAMYDYFKQKQFCEGSIYVPFNEAMCVGEAGPDIFSANFIKYRCDAHHVTIDKYNQITLKPLQVLFEKEFFHIVLWFDDDMFCQINLLTLLAYLDQTNYSRNITFNLLSREFKVADRFVLSAQGYLNIYRQVMVDRCMPKNIVLPVLEKGIRLYFEYIKEENEITAYIRQHENLQSNILISELLRAFPQYGLGDTQYMRLIEKCRNSVL